MNRQQENPPSGARQDPISKKVLISTLCGVAGLLLVAGTLVKTPTPPGLRLGQGVDGPWWMRETALSSEGRLDLRKKTWWERAKSLETGEELRLSGSGPTPGDMLVRRERVRRHRRPESNALVWIIDDDLDGSLDQGGDRDSDCYVADYDADGLADRMVDFIDNDGDQDPDEVEIRYFENGDLRYAWFGDDLDDDQAVWSIVGYEYGGPSYFEGDPHGDGMIYLNKLDPIAGLWRPIGECPFAFFDSDQDGYSETAVRVSVVPASMDDESDPDPANSYSLFGAPWNPRWSPLQIVNVRYSFDVDNRSGPKTPLHYEMGFNLEGRVPFASAGEWRTNPKRRPPQSTLVIPFKKILEFSDGFRAVQTGFSWQENFDDTAVLGYGPERAKDYRWEGVFWIWERRLMANTGGPTQKWNVRREWSDVPSERRRLYYSGVDKRIHLFGAKEGWTEIGHFSGMPAWGEIRTLDTDGNGFFDRWEVLRAGDPTPIRTTVVRDEKARELTWDIEEIRRFYQDEVLPAAVADNAAFLLEMGRLLPFQAPPELEAALATGSPGFRRYAQDLIREIQYQELRRHFLAAIEVAFKGLEKDDLRRPPNPLGEHRRDSREAWEMAVVLAQLDTAYGQGDLRSAVSLLKKLEPISRPLPPAEAKQQ